MDLRGLRVRHLELMLALEETGQVGAAAHRLGLSQPAASRAIAEIEKLLATPVCVREPRGVALTSVGAALARRARTILLELRQASREIDEMTQGGSGYVSIGSVTAPLVSHVVPAVLALRKTWPALRFHLEVATSDVLLAGLMTGRFDAVLARLPALADPAAFDVTPLAGERLELICDADHPLATERSVGLEDAAGFDWVMQPRPALLRRAVEDAFLRQGADLPERVIDTTSFLATLGLLRGAEAVAPVAAEVAEVLTHAIGSRLRRVPLRPAIDVEPYALISRANQTLSPAAARLRDMVLERAGAAPSKLSNPTEGPIA